MRLPQSVPIPALRVDDTVPAPPKVPRLAYTINEACEGSTLSRATIYRLIEDGKLRSVVIGTRRLIPADALHDLCSNGTA